MQDVEIDKPIEEYASHKPGDILTAPETGKKYEVFEDRNYSTSIASWVGLCGSHYYGRLNIYIISIGDVGNDDLSYGGYMGGLKIERDIRVEVTTPITEEHRKWDRERFGPDDTITIAFLNEEDAEAAIKAFEEKHLKGWECTDHVDDEGE